MRILLGAVLALALLAATAPNPVLPNAGLTPGVTLNVTAAQVCTPDYARSVRNVPASEKLSVYREYGIGAHRPGEYEVDHLISLELGGSNDIHNLWPQSYQTQPWNAHVKDRLENVLHQLVCAGKLPLQTAQDRISTNWINAYRQYVGRP